VGVLGPRISVRHLLGAYSALCGAASLVGQDHTRDSIPENSLREKRFGAVRGSAVLVAPQGFRSIETKDDI
jgi:hypothetical protein